ncbi:uncharacterized protein LOC130986057 [Salvia miltiorrhiza]|uniref:uncharacterized protein LOC130986057 n=1 Tax=Salvia miltiorrhiza TaxID=226208 RepID=UPI0025AB8565|nr:uncharacterized protein LOC130986057 [Salvia miltiorrhiza]
MSQFSNFICFVELKELILLPSKHPRHPSRCRDHRQTSRHFSMGPLLRRHQAHAAPLRPNPRISHPYCLPHHHSSLTTSCPRPSIRPTDTVSGDTSSSQSTCSLSLTYTFNRCCHAKERKNGGSGGMLNRTYFPWIKIKRENVEPLFIKPKFFGTGYWDIEELLKDLEAVAGEGGSAVGEILAKC